MHRTGAGDLTHAFACELIDGVNACHNKGLAHGDLEGKASVQDSNRQASHH